MQDAELIWSRKRRSSRAVVAGCSLITVALILSAQNFAAPLITTLGALVGSCLMLYGFNLAWLVFYEREPDGPSS